MKPAKRKRRHAPAGLAAFEPLEGRLALASSADLPSIATAASASLPAVVANIAPPLAGQTQGSILVADLGIGAAGGIAITGTQLQGGRLFYSVDGGITWGEVGPVSPTAAQLLQADSQTRLYFQPATGSAAGLADVITCKAWEPTNGFANGATGVDTLLKPAQTIRRIASRDAATATAVSPNGQFAITADRAGGIVVTSLASPAEAEAIAHLDTPGAAVGITIAADGSQAFIADDYGGVQVISLADPANPVITATVEPINNGYALGVAAAGSRYLFVAASSQGLDIVDLNAPGGPAIVKNVPLNDYAVSVTASADGRHAYIGTITGLVIVDALSPATAQVVRSVATGGSVEGVAVHPSGSHLLLACAQDGVKVVAVTNPTAASVVKTIPTSGTAWSVAVAPNGGRAYVGLGRDGGVEVLNVTTPAQATLIGAIHATGFTVGTSVTPDNRYVLVADGSVGTRLVDTAIPQRTQVVNTAGGANRVAITSGGDYAFVADDTSGLAIIQLNNSGAATVAGTVATGRFAADVALSGTNRYAYVADTTTGLVVVDAVNRSAPSVARTIASPTNAIAVEVTADGAYAAVADRFGGFVLYSLANPAVPSEAGRVGGLWPVTDMAIDAARQTAILATDYRGIQVFDISSPATPRSVATLNLPGTAVAVAVSADGSRAYVAAGEDGLHIVDLSNRTAPVRIGTFLGDAPVTGVSVSDDGTQLYVATTQGVAILLTAAADGPILVGVLETPGTAKATVVSSQGKAVVAVGSAGVFLRDVTAPAGFSRASSGIEAANYGTVESRGNVALARDAGGVWRANETPVQTPAGTESMLGIWQLAEAETIGGSNLLFARHPSGAVHRLVADSNWQLIGFSGVGNADSRWLPGTARGQAAPPDTSNPIPTGVTVPLDLVGGVFLRHDAAGTLYADATPLSQAGSPLSLSTLGDLRPLAAEVFPTGNHLLLRSPANELIVWNFTSEWAFTDADSPVAANTITGLGLLALFGVGGDGSSS